MSVQEHVDKPWGYYETMDEGEGTDGNKWKVKRLYVKPGGQLSLQQHPSPRDEFWLVVKGTAIVTIDDKVTEHGPGELVHIPRLSWHRLECAEGADAVEVIETQYGDTGETNILREKDIYGREGTNN